MRARQHTLRKLCARGVCAHRRLPASLARMAHRTTMHKRVNVCWKEGSVVNSYRRVFRRGQVPWAQNQDPQKPFQQTDGLFVEPGQVSLFVNMLTMISNNSVWRHWSPHDSVTPGLTDITEQDLDPGVVLHGIAPTGNHGTVPTTLPPAHGTLRTAHGVTARAASLCTRTPVRPLWHSCTMPWLCGPHAHF